MNMSRKLSSCLFAAAAAFVAWAELSDDWLSVSDDTAVIRTFGTRHILIFTDTASAATVTLKKSMTLDEYLVVGGGGGGGNNSSGGGGGGGGVVHSNVLQSVSAGTELIVTVGAGGETSTARYGAGSQGGHSSLAFDGHVIFGYGGHGGGPYNANLEAVAEGKVGSGGGTSSGRSVGTDGSQWNSAQGNQGASRRSSSVGGGGGGAGAPASYDYGGEGLPFAISGKWVVYGSGGGGGVESSPGFGGKGGTNAGNGGVSAKVLATAGVDGTGGGGGGGGVQNSNAQRGGKGGSGTVILAFSEAASGVSRFAVQPIADQLLVSSAACPSVTVTNGLGEVLSPTDDYSVSYVANDGAGDAVAVVQGAADTAYAGYTAICPFRIHAVAYEDDNIVASDAGVSNVVVGNRHVYIFTNVGETVVFRAKRLLTRDRMLLVGGGGSGGGVSGGGGGGGGYVVDDSLALFAAAREGTLRVGAGADAYPVVQNDTATGRQGGHTWLNLGEGAVFAYGGGGGGRASVNPPPAAVYNEIGSGGGSGTVSPGQEGTHWNASQGHAGGACYNANIPGGGGGAYLKAVNGGTLGGEGMTNDITGVKVVYGSGGGGYPPSGLSGAGGTNAGSAFRSGARGGNGVDGTGGGGGGGGENNAKTGPGGDGGSGTVVLSFEVGDRVNGRFSVDPIPEQLYCDRPVKPSVSVRNPAGDLLVENVDYTVKYEDCDRAGLGKAIVSGFVATIFEGFSVEVSCVIRSPRYIDDFIYTDDDDQVQRIDRGERVVYVFTNTAAPQVVHFVKRACLRRALLVGGGGSGGTANGGGGGGGGVLAKRINRKFEFDECLTVQVGAGALPTPPGGGDARYISGKQGGHSSLTTEGLSFIAYGGGGGGGMSYPPTAAGAENEIGSGGGAAGSHGVGSKGIQWYQGNEGGRSEDGSNLGGGGGGMLTAGGVGFKADNTAGHGGEGVTNSITGVAVVYGSGGGGGANEKTAGQGGTNAGAGGDGKVGNDVGHPGVDGTGGGGGGGGRRATFNYQGGRGGCGTVILEIAPVQGSMLIIR